MSIVEIVWAVHHYFMPVEVDILIRYVLNIYEIRRFKKFEIKYVYSSPRQLRYPQLSYFHSYTILSRVQKNSS